MFFLIFCFYAFNNVFLPLMLFAFNALMSLSLMLFTVFAFNALMSLAFMLLIIFDFVCRTACLHNVDKSNLFIIFCF